MGKEEPSNIEQQKIHPNNIILPQKKSVAFINDNEELEEYTQKIPGIF
jgi:hypothetical protein